MVKKICNKINIKKHFFQNEDYSEALEDRFQQIYKKSWIGQYFDYEVRVNDDGIVYYFNNATQEDVNTYRFMIFISIPKNTRKYFFPDSYWDNFFQDRVIPYILVDNLSDIKHGCITNGYPYSQTQFYTPPFFIIFKTQQSIKPNYLKFNNFLKQNSEHCVLAMLVYDSNKDQFVPQFSPGLTLPYSNTLNLNNILEFQIIDSNSKPLAVSDFSQLFVSIKAIEN